MPKKIIYCSSADISEPYGPGVNELNFIKDMSSRSDIDFTALLPRPVNPIPQGIPKNRLVFYGPKFSTRTLFGSTILRCFGFLKAWKLSSSAKFDYAIIRTGMLPLAQIYLAHLMKGRYLVKTAGNGNYSEFSRRNLVKRLLARVNISICNYILNNAKLIDVVSNEHKKSLTKTHPSITCAIKVIDNGVDIKLFTPKVKHKEQKELITIGYIGGFPYSRGGKHVVDLVKALAESQNVKGLIVGDSGEAQRCKDYARSNGVMDSVTITGTKPFSEIPNIMREIDIGLSILPPEKRGSSEQKVRQYLSAGCCVIGTAGSNEFIRGQPFAQIIDNDHPDESALKSAFFKLISDKPNSFEEKKIKARFFAEKNLSITARNDIRLKLLTAD